jgi:hypothetical protein
MPSFGALRQIARGASVEKKLKSLTVHMPEEEKGDVRVEHEYAAPHGPASFKFGAAERDGLSAHLQQHLGIRMPGKAAGSESAESEVSKENFD